MIDREALARECGSFGITLTEAQQEAFDRYGALLAEWNQRMNLTAITKPEEMVTKHFADSLSLCTAVDLPQGAKVVDVGTGAGFPGVPLKILHPQLELTLLDSLNKRILFLEQLSRQLGQENRCIHLRAEEAGRKPEYRECFDLATARAVAHLRELAEYCLPLVRVGGLFAAMKGAEIQQELGEAQEAIRILGGTLQEVRQLELADGSGRSIVVIKKISQTPPKYPRTYGNMKKNPLK